MRYSIELVVLRRNVRRRCKVSDLVESCKEFVRRRGRAIRGIR